MFELPVAQGLVVCQRVDVDPVSGLPTLVNRITTIRVRRFPSRPVRLAVFAALTNGYGEIPSLLSITHLGSDALVMQHQSVLRFTDRLRAVPYTVAFSGVVFPAPGAYEVALFAADEPLARYRLEVSLRNSGGGYD